MIGNRPITKLSKQLTLHLQQTLFCKYFKICHLTYTCRKNIKNFGYPANSKVKIIGKILQTYKLQAYMSQPLYVKKDIIPGNEGAIS